MSLLRPQEQTDEITRNGHLSFYRRVCFVDTLVDTRVLLLLPINSTKNRIQVSIQHNLSRDTALQTHGIRHPQASAAFSIANFPHSKRIFMLHCVPTASQLSTLLTHRGWQKRVSCAPRVTLVCQVSDHYSSSVEHRAKQWQRSPRLGCSGLIPTLRITLTFSFL